MFKSFIKKQMLNLLRRLMPEIMEDYYLPEGWHDGYNAYSHVFVDNKSLVHIGQGSFLNHNNGLYVGGGNAHITIGKNVFVANDCVITTCSHEIGTPNQRAGTCTYQDVTIEDGVWIGTHSTILPGVTIGKGCIIAAGSVVNHDCLPNCLYAGVPAKKIRSL